MHTVKISTFQDETVSSDPVDAIELDPNETFDDITDDQNTVNLCTSRAVNGIPFWC